MSSSLGLGLACVRPERRVVVLDGDGAALMRLGALATIGAERPPNLVHVLLDNEAHDSTGGQPTVASRCDLGAVARACGYPRVLRAGSGEPRSRAPSAPTAGVLTLRAREGGAEQRAAAAATRHGPSEAAARLAAWLAPRPPRDDGAAGGRPAERSAALVARDDRSGEPLLPLSARAAPAAVGDADARSRRTRSRRSHTLLGLAAAGMRVRARRRFLIAAACWEVHLLLDCLDGALARGAGHRIGARTLARHPRRLRRLPRARGRDGHPRPGGRARAYPRGRSRSRLIASGAIAAWAHDFYLRKFTAALTTGTDPIYEQLLAKHRVIRGGGAGFVAWFGYVFEWLQIIWLQPGTRARAPASPPRRHAAARRLARSARASRAVPTHRAGAARFRAVSLMSNDNDVTILGLGLLTGHLVAAQVVAIAWASATLLLGSSSAECF